MPALWKIEVLAKGADWVQVEVRQAHPDAGEFPTSRAFALRLLHEQAWKLDRDFKYKATGPLGEACTDKQVLDEGWLAANAAKLIAEIAPEATATPAIDEATAERQVADQLGVALDALSDADRERLDAAYEAFWRDTSKLPARRYRIQVTDPAYLAHLAPGARWNSAAF